MPKDTHLFRSETDKPISPSFILSHSHKLGYAFHLLRQLLMLTNNNIRIDNNVPWRPQGPGATTTHFWRLYGLL